MIEARERHVPLAAVILVEEEIRPDLVAHHRDPVPRREVGELQKVCAAKHRAGGIVRVAEPKEF